jgi:LPS sulfotransferase NodH
VTRFVILATPRSGSNWLCALLDSHPRILCHHELFNPEGVHLALSQRGKDWVLGDKKMQEEAPLDLLDEAWKNTLGFDVVGFKLNLGQSPLVLDEVLADSAILKILIRRRNRVRTFVSEKIAEMTGQWESYPDSAWDDRPKSLTLKLDELNAHVARNRDFYLGIRQRLEDDGQQALELEYENLGSEQLHRRLLRYLGVDPDVALSAATKKMNNSPLHRMISNYAELKIALSGTELEQDLLEDDYQGDADFGEHGQ